VPAFSRPFPSEGEARVLRDTTQALQASALIRMVTDQWIDGAFSMLLYRYVYYRTVYILLTDTSILCDFAIIIVSKLTVRVSATCPSCDGRGAVPVRARKRGFTDSYVVVIARCGGCGGSGAVTVEVPRTEKKILASILAKMAHLAIAQASSRVPYRL
jgi:hypothetical protein